MSIFPLPLLLVVSSCLLCPVASLPGQKVKEVQTLPGQAGRHCTSAHLLTSAADCLAAAKALGLGGSVYTLSSSGAPPGCIWTNYLHPGQLAFNTYKASTKACGDGTNFNYMCLCVYPCPIATYQNEESSATCKSCLPGTYNDETGKALCNSCPKGWDTTSPGSTGCNYSPAHTVKEVKSGHCISAELIGTVADCTAAAKVLGLKSRYGAHTTTSGNVPPGCSWSDWSGGHLLFNPHKGTTKACGDGIITFGSNNPMCLCVDPCPIGTYQNEESSTTCKSCLPGTYNDETGRSSCQNCTIGKYNNEIGESTCRNCPAGKNSARGASNCQPNCCHAKANYPTYEKDCNTITDAAACSDRLHHLKYTCDWNCDVTTVNMHNVSQNKYLGD